MKWICILYLSILMMLSLMMAAGVDSGSAAQNQDEIEKLVIGVAGSMSNVELNVANNVLENW